MLLMLEKDITRKISLYLLICKSLKCMKSYDKNKESSCFQYWDAINLYGWAMSQKLPVNNFEGIKDSSHFNDFIKNCNEESHEEYFPKIDVQYPESLHNLHGDLLFLPKRMKIEKFGKLVTNLHDKIEYVIHIKKIKTIIKSWISFEKIS